MEMEQEKVDQMSSIGMIDDEKLLCQYVENQANKSVWRGGNPLQHSTSLLMFQIILIFIVSRITHFMLKPSHQTLLIAQIVAGIIVGPSILGPEGSSFEKLFPIPSRMTLRTISEFGMVMYFFKMGVQVNPKQILKIEKQAIVIGISGYVSSFFLGNVVSSLVERISPSGFEEVKRMRILVVVTSQSAFPVVSSFLHEMNILNSEIGRMALSTSMVSEACYWVFYFVVIDSAKALHLGSCKPLLQLGFAIGYFAALFFLLRPLVIWISNRNPTGKPMTESHFISIICILLFVAFSAQVVGQPSFLVSFWFGLILPDGPPLGSVLAERLDTMGSTLLVPAYCAISGLRTIVPSSTGSKWVGIEAILMAMYIGKFGGTILPSLYFQIEFWDSFALALIMCCKGLVDLCIYNFLLNTKVIGDLSFTVTIYTMVAETGFATLVVYYMYDPSRRYRTYIRKSIIDSEKDTDLKLLVCIHNEENVYPMINLLQISNPTKTTPLSIFVLHLMELQGRATSILARNNNTKNSCHYTDTSSQHIGNVFDQFQLHNKDCVMLQCFTAISPYASMHEDVCYMTMDTKSNFVIVPFHKQWSMNGNIEVSNASIRTLNQKVLNKALCSVGILIDRSQMSGNILVIHEETFCEIAMIFLGGADDQEALTYSMRLAQHSNVRLTLIWVRPVKMEQKQWNMKNPYIGLMEQIRYNSNYKGKVDFKEEIVEDGAGTTQVIRGNIEGHFSLVIVGRHHIVDSPCILGLKEWCEFPELGPIGNLLATSDFTFSVLVVQQRPFYL